MEIKNLNNEDVEELETKIKDLKVLNPDITYKVLKGGIPSEKPVDNRSIPEMIDETTKLCEEIKLLFKHTFGNHVLINGKFEDPMMSLERKT